jgi:hypothetical protein
VALLQNLLLQDFHANLIFDYTFFKLSKRIMTIFMLPELKPVIAFVGFAMFFKNQASMITCFTLTVRPGTNWRPYGRGFPGSGKLMLVTLSNFPDGLPIFLFTHQPKV